MTDILQNKPVRRVQQVELHFITGHYLSAFSMERNIWLCCLRKTCCPFPQNTEWVLQHKWNKMKNNVEINYLAFSRVYESRVFIGAEHGIYGKTIGCMIKIGCNCAHDSTCTFNEYQDWHKVAVTQLLTHWGWKINIHYIVIAYCGMFVLYIIYMLLEIPLSLVQ